MKRATIEVLSTKKLPKTLHLEIRGDTPLSCLPFPKKAKAMIKKQRPKQLP